MGRAGEQVFCLLQQSEDVRRVSLAAPYHVLISNRGPYVLVSLIVTIHVDVMAYNLIGLLGGSTRYSQLRSLPGKEHILLPMAPDSGRH